VVIRVDGAFLLPDVAAHTVRPCAEPAYGVRFEAAELWGAGGDPRGAVYVDLWESYLEVPA
jgi:nitrile hydratase